MTKLRAILLVLVVIICSTAIDGAAAYYLAKTPSGQAALRDFLVAESKANFAAQQAAATSTPAVATSTQPGILLIPKSFATQEYYEAINNVLQDLYTLNTVSGKLGPMLDSLNRQTLSCSFTGFYEAMGQAHQLANKNQALISQLTFHLTALAAANTQTKDVLTKAYTQTLVAQGNALAPALQAYATSLNELLAGDTPTSAQIAQFQSQVNVATGASQAFADALKPLLSHITEELLKIVKAAEAAASSTPAKK